MIHRGEFGWKQQAGSWYLLDRAEVEAKAKVKAQK